MQRCLRAVGGDATVGREGDRECCSLCIIGPRHYRRKMALSVFHSMVAPLSRTYIAVAPGLYQFRWHTIQHNRITGLLKKESIKGSISIVLH